ncbi:MAG: hypothetical protein LRY35_01660 [Clostridiales bacterium]|nr:hypothetical protein [Clostridiales bacterium]
MNQDNAITQFEALYHQTFRRLSQYVLFKAGSVSDTEDIVAAVYADYFQHVASAAMPSPPIHMPIWSAWPTTDSVACTRSARP